MKSRNFSYLIFLHVVLGGLLTAPVHAEDVRMKSFQLLQKGDVSGSIKCFEATLRRNPNDLDSLLGIAQALKLGKNNKAAAEYYRKILQKRPANRVALISLIDILELDPKSRDESVSLLKSFVREHPKDMMSKRKLAFILCANPATAAEAMPLLYELHAIRPTDAEITLTLARLTNWKPTWPEAEKYYNEYLELKPDDYNARLDLAALYSWEKHSRVEAAHQYDELLKMKDDPKIRLDKAIFLAWNGGGAEAVKEFEKLNKQTPTLTLDGTIDGVKQKVPVLLYAAQVANVSAHSYDTSERLYGEYLKLHPDAFHVRIELANMLWQAAKKPDEAINQLAVVLKTQPGDAAVRARKILLEISQKRGQEALSDLRVLSEQKPTTPVIDFFFQGRNREVSGLIAYARYLDVMGNRAEAKKVLERYIALKPGDTLARKEIADIEQRDAPGTPQLSESDIDKLIVENPSVITYKQQKAMLLMARKQYAEALPLWRQIVDREPLGENSLHYLVQSMHPRPALVAYALCLERAGQLTDAEKNYRLYLDARPHDQLVRLQLAMLLSRESRLKAKEDALEQLNIVIAANDSPETDKDESTTARAKFLRTDILSQQKNYDQALNEIDKLIAVSPHQPRITIREGEFSNPSIQRALILMSAKKFAEAESQLASYIAQPGHGNDRYALRMRAEAIGRQSAKREQALAEFEFLLNQNPGDELLLKSKIHMLNQLGRAADSVKELTALRAKHDDDATVVSELAFALKNLNKNQEAIAELSRWLSEHEAKTPMSERIPLICQLGQYMIDAKDKPLAQKLFEDELRACGDNDRLYAGLACALASQNKTSEAQICAEKSLSLADNEDLVWRSDQLAIYPPLKKIVLTNLKKVMSTPGQGTPDQLLCLANLELWDKEHQQTGIKDLRRYLQMYPDDYEARKSLANVLAWSNHTAESIRIYKQLLAEHADEITLQLQLAQAELAGKTTKAQSVKDFELYLQFRPDDQEARQQLADALGSAGRPSPAIEIYKALLKQKPNDHRLLLGLSHAEVSTPATRKQGIEHAKQYLSLEPSDKEATHFLASILSWQRGQEKSALELYRQLGPEGSEDEQLKREYAGLLFRTGGMKQALALMRSMLAADPKNRTALLGLADIYTQAGYIMKAESILKEARRLYPEDEQAAMMSAFNFRNMGRYDLAFSELKRWKHNMNHQENEQIE